MHWFKYLFMLKMVLLCTNGLHLARFDCARSPAAEKFYDFSEPHVSLMRFHIVFSSILLSRVHSFCLPALKKKWFSSRRLYLNVQGSERVCKFEIYQVYICKAEVWSF